MNDVSRVQIEQRRSPAAACFNILAQALAVVAISAGAGGAETVDRPYAPEPVEISGTTRTSIAIQWTSRSGPDLGWILERRALGGGWRRLTVVSPGSSRSSSPADRTFRFVDSDLTPDTYYCFRLIAFTEKTSAVSPERCTQTDAPPRVLEKRRLPAHLAQVRLNNRQLQTAGEVYPCADPVIAEAIEQAREALSSIGADISDLPTYSCAPGGWGLDDFGEFFDDLKDFLDEAADAAECTGRGLAVVGACPGLAGVSLLACIGDLTAGGTCPIQVCTEDDFGTEECRIEEGPCWLGACLLTIPTTKICVEAAQAFDRNCLADE